MMIKQFSSVRALGSNLLTSSGRQKTCKNCGESATKEALFEVGNGIMVVERYCERCVDAAIKGSVA
ncbi:MAG: hypothetical protein ABI347_07005 [Nitrososphaera sp.]|jgi:DnaJ-class molecular chaperone